MCSFFIIGTLLLHIDVITQHRNITIKQRNSGHLWLYEEPGMQLAGLIMKENIYRNRK